MIFVTLGSQKFQFNRILIEIDKLIEDKYITENVFAQTGYSVIFETPDPHSGFSAKYIDETGSAI